MGSIRVGVLFFFFGANILKRNERGKNWTKNILQSPSDRMEDNLFLVIIDYLLIKNVPFSVLSTTTKPYLTTELASVCSSTPSVGQTLK